MESQIRRTEFEDALDAVKSMVKSKKSKKTNYSYAILFERAERGQQRGAASG